MPIPYHPTPTVRPPTSSTPSKWGPYSGAGDFTANIVIILISLFCALVLAIALNAVIRHLLCALRHREEDSHDQDHPSSIVVADPEKQSVNPTSSASVSEPFPTLIFSAGTKLAGAETPDCAICLAEFVNGDWVRVLPACNHGFHVQCVERWLVSSKSCPTCRTSYRDHSINIDVV